MNRTYLLACIPVFIIVALVVFAYTHGAGMPVLEPAGPVALAERGVISITVLLCAIVVVPVFFLLFFFAYKYRAESPQAPVHHEPDWDHDNLAAEFSWWVVPTIIIAALAVIMWQSAHALDPYRPLSGGTPLEVQVVALDWKWLFIYPSLGIASVNMLELPENTPVHFDLTADAPMNSFWIPQLGGQIMVMPGMTTQLNLMASRTGDFRGFSGNISGAGFAGMAFEAKSVSESDFEAWVASTRQMQNPLTVTAYALLTAPSQYNPVELYSSVSGGLYTRVMMKFMIPAATMAPMNMQ